MNKKKREKFTYRRKLMVSQKGCEQMFYGNLIAKRGLLAFQVEVEKGSAIFLGKCRQGRKTKTVIILANFGALGNFTFGRRCVYIHTGKFLVRIAFGIFCLSMNC